MSTSTDLEAQQREEDAGYAHEIQHRILHAIADGRKALWDLAEAAFEFDEAHGWTKLGYDTKSAWLADADITISRTTWDRYVRTWRKLVIEKRIDSERIRQLDQSKVAIVTDKISSDEVLVDDALDDVEALGAKDLREKYYGKAEDPATTVPDDSGQLDEDAELLAQEIEELDADAPTFGEVVVGEVVGGLEDAEVLEPVLPSWVNDDSVRALVQEFESANASGAPFPRVDRKNVQIALELALAWLSPTTL